MPSTRILLTSAIVLYVATMCADAKTDTNDTGAKALGVIMDALLSEDHFVSLVTGSWDVINQSRGRNESLELYGFSPDGTGRRRYISACTDLGNGNFQCSLDSEDEFEWSFNENNKLEILLPDGSRTTSQPVVENGTTIWRGEITVPGKPPEPFNLINKFSQRNVLLN